MVLSVVFIIVLLIAMNAFYVVSEFAAVSLRPTRLRGRAHRGDSRAKWLLDIVDDPKRLDRYVATSQIGITVSSLLLGALGEAELAPVLLGWLTAAGFAAEAGGSMVPIVVLLGLTVVQMVFGELVPKTLSMRDPIRMAYATSWGMRLSQRVFKAPLWLLNGSGRGLMRLFGHTDDERHVCSPREVEALIAESQRGGALEPTQQRRLLNALTLGRKPVASVMTERDAIDHLDIEADESEAVDAIMNSRFTRLLVSKDGLDNIVGLIHARDVAVQSTRDTDFRLTDLVRSIVSVEATTSLDLVLTRMQRRRTHVAVVTDEEGKTVGLVTVDDLLGELLAVGTESATKSEGVRHAEGGRVRLSKNVRMRQAAPWVGPLSKDVAVSIEKALEDHLGRSPSPGERLVIGNVEVEVEGAEEGGVEAFLVRPVSNPEWPSVDKS